MKLKAKRGGTLKKYCKNFYTRVLVRWNVVFSGARGQRKTRLQRAGGVDRWCVSKAFAFSTTHARYSCERITFGRSLSKIRIYSLTWLLISNISALIPTNSRHSPYTTAQLRVIQGIFGTNLALIGKNEVTAYQIGVVIWLSVKIVFRCLFASDSETFHYFTTTLD